jgi:hypothetical protein
MTRKPLAVLLSLLASAPAFAGNLSLGPVKLNPYYGFESRYEDNIYRVPRDQNGHAVSGGGVRGSMIYANNLGLKLALPVGQHKFNAAYDFTAENYQKQSKANNAYNSKADAGYKYEGSKLDANLSNSYINTQDPAFNPNGTVINGDLVARQRRWQNTMNAGVEYGLGEKFFAGVNGEWLIQRYLDRSGGANSLANQLNRSEGTFGLKTGYKVAPKTKVYVSFARRLVHYTEETRQDNHRDWLADVGVEGDLTAKLKGKIQTGFEYRHYDRDSANPRRDLIGRVWRVSTALDFAATETTKLNLVINRATNESSAANQARYFTSAGATLGVQQKFGAKITAGLNGGYQQDRFSQNFTVGGVSKARRDDSYNGGAKLDYKFTETVSAGLSYLHNSRFSTFSREYNYRDNVTGANVRLNF